MDSNQYKLLTHAQREQWYMMKKEREWRQKMEVLEKENKIEEFWECYIKYLENNNIISPYRQTMYNMVKKTLKKLRDLNGNLERPSRCNK